MAEKVVIGMSGGVDSSVAAALLKEQGYEVIGVTMKLHNGEQADAGCCSISAVNDARRVADAIGIPHYVMNFTDAFRRHVIDYFIEEYRQGRTPNPCTACNRYVKFDALLDKAIALGAGYIATGHYAHICRENGRWLLRCAHDSRKDQTYFLYSMTQRQLAHTLMPLHGITKEETRRCARELGLSVHQKKDSQEICFVPDNDYAAFIREEGGATPPGEFVFEGRPVGTHQGIYRYTVGQRKGLGLALGQPVYVTRIDPRENRVYLGVQGSQLKRELFAGELNWIAVDKPAGPVACRAKIRYNAPAAPCVAAPEGDGLRVTFDEPQKAVTPGQSVVLYDGSNVLGGGVIRD